MMGLEGSAVGGVWVLGIAGIVVLLAMRMSSLKRQLAISETERRRLIETTNEGYWLIEPVHKITIDVNQALCTMLGYTADEMIGRCLFDFAAEGEAHIFKTQTQTIATANHRTYEITLMRKDGTPIHTLFNGTTIWNDDGTPRGSFAFVTDLTHRKCMEEELREQATTDFLTCALNRRQFLRVGADEFDRCKRYNRQASVLLLDVDHFKQVNDQHGHAIGDEVLVRVVQILKKQVRANDQCGRLGGEEFAVLLSETNADSAVYLAERMRKAIEAESFDAGQDLPRVSVSIGVTEYKGEGDTIERALVRADEALYCAKRDGRNLCRLAV